MRSVIDKLIMSVTPDSDRYPPLLREIPDRPKVLYVMNPVIDWGNSVPIAVAGTRNPTPYGIRLTRRIVRELVYEGYTPIVTGGARGIDRIALRVFVSHGGDGVKVPPCIKLNDYIYDSTVEKISEHLCTGNWSVQMNGWLVKRNRIIVGTAYALVIPEVRISNPHWREYGVACCGTQHAVRYARQYGREAIVIKPQDSPEDVREAYEVIVETGAVPVSTIDELITELRIVTRR